MAASKRVLDILSSNTDLLASSDRIFTSAAVNYAGVSGGPTVGDIAPDRTAYIDDFKGTHPGDFGVQKGDEVDLPKAEPTASGEPTDAFGSFSYSRTYFDGRGDVIDLYQGKLCGCLPKEPFLYFDWLLRFWVYFDTVPHGVSWLSAFAVWIGALWFMVGTFATVAPAVASTYDPTGCAKNAYFWWAYFTYLVGDVGWLVAFYLAMLEAINHGYVHNMAAWEQSGCLGPKPRYRWVGFEPCSLEFMSGLVYEVGVLFFLAAQIVSMLAVCPSWGTISNEVSTWCINYFFIAGGICFFVAGAGFCACLVSPWILPAILVPFKRKHWTSMLWWAIWAYFWGGALFFMACLFLYWNSPLNYVLDPNTYKWENSWGFGGGSFLFWIGATLLLMRQARGRCRPSFMPVENNNEATLRVGARFALNDVGAAAAKV